jgi:hypothetical protein
MEAASGNISGGFGFILHGFPRVTHHSPATPLNSTSLSTKKHTAIDRNCFEIRRD